MARRPVPRRSLLHWITGIFAERAMVVRVGLLAGFLAVACLAAPGAAIALPGDHFEVSPDNLPQPGATLPDDVDADFTRRPPGATPQVPQGFAISILASNLGDARWMAVAPNGDVFLAQRGQGRILLLRDANGDGNAETITVFAQGFSRPHGLAFHDGALYVEDVRA